LESKLKKISTIQFNEVSVQGKRMKALILSYNTFMCCFFSLGIPKDVIILPSESDGQLRCKVRDIFLFWLECHILIWIFIQLI